MTVEANGDITTVVSFKNDSEPTRTATYTARAIQASGNVYYWDSEGLNGADALLPGITGLGVANFRFKPGFILEEGHYTPIAFTTDINTEFDYSNYRDFPLLIDQRAIRTGNSLIKKRMLTLNILFLCFIHFHKSIGLNPYFLVRAQLLATSSKRRSSSTRPSKGMLIQYFLFIW